MLFSIIIPARNEEKNIQNTISDILKTTKRENIPTEIVVVLDNCNDQTEILATATPHQLGEIITTKTPPQKGGIGIAIAQGLKVATGEAIAIMMADGSDNPKDAIRYYQELQKGYDCVFGTRFSKGGKTHDYPIGKLIINRLANAFIKLLFQIPLDDTTNAFKAYKKSTIQGITPLISHHFNVTVEMPLKAIVRGFSYSIIPIQWTNRKYGTSKLKIQEMGSRYLFICLYLWLEKALAKNDYHK